MVKVLDGDFAKGPCGAPSRTRMRRALLGSFVAIWEPNGARSSARLPPRDMGGLDFSTRIKVIDK
jgi:hypothetical protein